MVVRHTPGSIIATCCFFMYLYFRMLAVLGVITVLTAVMAGLIFTITIVGGNKLCGIVKYCFIIQLLGLIWYSVYSLCVDDID